MIDTVRYLADFQPAIDGIKLQLLHILRGTKLAELYEQAPFPVFSMDEYIELLIECIRLLPPDMVIHRISGDGPKKLLVAPEWSGNKRAFLNTFSKALRESGCFQGAGFHELILLHLHFSILINLHAVRKPLYLLVKRLFLPHIQLSRISGR